MTGQPEAVRCARCHEEWTLTTNLLTGDPIWTAPRSKRRGCPHPSGEVEILNECREWVAPS